MDFLVNGRLGRESGELVGAIVWVHDFETEQWLEAGTAFFVPTVGVTSPMGHGILAFSEEARAQALAGDLDGEVIPWETVTELPVKEGLLGDHHQEMGYEMDH